MRIQKMKILATLAALLLAPAIAIAQTSPNLRQSQVLTPAQWNNLFASKQDTLGYVPMNAAGGTFSGRIITAPSGASTSGFNLTPGSVPAAPANGDLWATSSGLFARIGGVTLNLFAPCPACAVTNATNTFTVKQLFTASGGGSAAALLASSVSPAFAWQATGQATDQQFWDAIAIGKTLQFRAVNGANNSADSFMTATRGAGATVSRVAIPNLAKGAQVYGASGSAQTTTGTISATSQTLTLGSAIDFRDNDGVYIFGAGAATSVGSPTLSAVAPINGTGSTTYAYKIASRSNNGGMKAATAAVTITNGQATLGTYQSGLSGIVMNQVTWTSGSGSPLCTAVWRSKSGGAYDLLGCFTGTSIFDTGLSTQTLFGIPATPPASDIADALMTSIVSGGGTTAVNLANAATTTATATAILHDDTAAIVAAAAANTALYFPCGTYRVHGWTIPSTLRSIQGDGGCSIISGLAQTADGAAVSASLAGGSFYMRGMTVKAALSMAFDGFTLSNGAKLQIYESDFYGATALRLRSSSDLIAQGNYISDWWNIGIDLDTDTDFLVTNNSALPISGQASTVPITGQASGGAYPWATGILQRGGNGLIAANVVTPEGGIWGISQQNGKGSVVGNLIRSSGAECIVLVGDFLMEGNECSWLPAGNGKLSSYDLGVSLSNTSQTSKGVVRGNKFTNTAYSGISVYGLGTGATYSVTISDNSFFGTNQIGTVNTCGIQIFGSDATGIVVGPNSFQSVTANMTYQVCEANNGTGVPSNNTVAQQLGSLGSLGSVHLIGSGSRYNYLDAPTIASPTFQFATGGSNQIIMDSSNGGFQNGLLIRNSGSPSDAFTSVLVSVSLTSQPLGYVQMVALGGVNPYAQLSSGAGLTGGFFISAGAGTLSIASPTITGSFTAPGLVTNAALANPSTTVNSQTCTLGSACTVTAVPSGSAGGELGGSYPNPTLLNASVIAKLLTGYSSGSGTVSATDSILSAIQKLNGNDALKLPLAGGTMSGAIAMGGNNITGGGTGSFTTLTGTGGSHTGLTGLGIRSTGAAFDLTLASTEVLTAGRTLTVTLNDAARTLNMGGNLTTAGAASLPAIAQGDLWYGSASGVVSALAKNTTATRYLSNTGTSNNPAWAQIDLTNGVTGATPVANGGTNATTTQTAAASLKVPYVFAQSYVQVPHTGDLLNATLATITIPANAMGANGCVRVTFYMSFTNNANNKTYNLLFNGTGGTVYVNVARTTVVNDRVQAQICNRNSTSSQVGNTFQAQGGFGSSTNSTATSSVNTTSAVDVVITGQLASAGDTIALEGYTAELLVP